MNSTRILTMLAAMALSAVQAQAGASKVVAFAWEFSRMSVRDLAAYADELDKTQVDGIGVYLNEPMEGGGTLSTHTIMYRPWSRAALEPLVPVARSLTAHRSMRESFVNTFRAPTRQRMEWADDAAWAVVASNMAIAAWFAKAGGFRGLSMDPEDYRHTAQFMRRAGEAPYDELAKLARRRGREVFEGVFREFPDVRIISFWFLSLEHSYLASDDPARDMRERGDLWPAFADGILDAITPGARIFDGCEHSYRYEAERGDFFRAAAAVRSRTPLLVSPENRAKYARALGVSFGLYMDMYTNPAGSSWYFGPAGGSRLGRFERNLVQAAEASEEYVWLWGEKFCWADWRGKGPKDERGIAEATWESRLPGLGDTMLAVKRPLDFAAKRGEERKAQGLLRPLNANPECVSEKGEVPAPYVPWQQKQNRQGRLYGDATTGDGDSFSLAAEGVENGAFSFSPARAAVPGERFLATVSAKGDGASALVAWKRDGKLDWNVLSPVQVRFGPENAGGWRRGRAVVRVPETADGLALSLSVRQNKGEKCNFDNVRLVPLGDRPDLFTLGEEAIGPDDGHVQGIAASEDALYVAQMERIIKVDWSGKVLKTRAVRNHTGDMAWHGGRLYTALAFMEGDRKVGRIQVFDADLNFVREAAVDRGIDGITCMGGVLYVGMGAKTQPSGDPHRVNVIGRFDAETLAEVAPRVDFDYGFDTLYGFQDMTNDGGLIYAAFYTQNDDPPMVVFDKDLKIVKTGHFDASQGIDVAPASLGLGRRAFVWSETGKKDGKPATCAVRLWMPEEGDFQ